MSSTIQIGIEVENDTVKEELIARLSDADFYAFEEKERELLAFIKEENFNSCVLETILDLYKLKYSKSLIEEQNWNALWESNFQPVTVSNFCSVRAEFHKPSKTTRCEIIITPKMSFGTGHHATTFMMISQMEKLDFKGKRVADFGTGTGVLSILAEKLGSEQVLALDNDDWSIENAGENIQKNGCSKITVKKVESFTPTQKFDVILANINKNVIMTNIDGLLFGLNENGCLLLSGFLLDDEADIVSAFTRRRLKHISTTEKAGWISLLFLAPL